METLPRRRWYSTTNLGFVWTRMMTKSERGVVPGSVQIQGSLSRGQSRWCSEEVPKHFVTRRGGERTPEMWNHVRMLLLLLLLLLALACAAQASNPGVDPPHFVLLLDCSDSMASQNRYEKMNVSVGAWIRNFPPDDIRLTLWKFTEDAKRIKSSVIDNTPTSRQEFLTFIPKQERGSSCVACALETVIQHEIGNYTILLITDGNDKHLEQDLKELTEKIEPSQLRIVAVLIGDSRNIHLFEELKEASVNYFPDKNTVLGLLNTLQAAFHTETNFSIPINIFEEEFSTENSSLKSTFSIDSTVSSKVCIYLYYWPYIMQVSMNVTVLGKTQQIPNAVFKHGYMEYCNLPEIMGQWTVDLFAPDFNKFIALQVTARKNVTDTGSDLTFDCWIEMGEKYLSIYGSVHSGKYLINNTKISVDIIAQDGEEKKQELRKIYSGSLENYFNGSLYVKKHLDLQKPGYYNARCRANGQLLSDSKTVSKFNRVSWAGTFRMRETYAKWSFPSEIDDLFASVKTHEKQYSVTLEFTAPTNAIKYKIMFLTSPYEVESGGGQILSTVPGNAGIKEKITLNIPLHSLTSPCPLYIAMSAIGDLDAEGEVSNIVLLRCPSNNTQTSVTPVESTEHSLRNFPDSTLLDTPGYISSTKFATPTPPPNSSPFPKENLITSPTTYRPNSSTAATNDNSNNRNTNIEQSSDSLGVGIIVGIIVLLFVLAIVSLCIYKYVYSWQKCGSYEVARRESNSLEPFNEHDDL